MNAQACILWFDSLQAIIRREIGPCSVELRPIHISLPIDDDRWIAIGDANGPIGFDSCGISGELGYTWESGVYVGDPVEDVAAVLIPQLKKALIYLKRTGS